MGNTIGMDILRENLSNILDDRKRDDTELIPYNNKDVLFKGLRYAFINGKIDRKKLDEYTKNYGIDSRNKIKIIISNQEENYYYIKGLIYYKKVVYKFYITDEYINIEELDF